MIKTNAFAAYSEKSPLEPMTIERAEPGPKEVLIEILFCGICHSDLHQIQNEWQNSIYPMVPGHEIIGRITQIGDQVRKWRTGDIVGVGGFIASCGQCSACKAGDEQFCEKGIIFTYNSKGSDYETVTYGGYSKRITVNENYVVRIPTSLPLECAAPLLCAGITTYSPLKHFGLKSGNRIAVAGLGGLGHMAVKFAKNIGAEVTVFSHTNKRQEDAMRLGADYFIRTDQEAIFQKNRGRFDFVIDTISAAHDYNSYLELLGRNGTMILVGLPPPSLLSPLSLLKNRRRLVGSNIAGIRETQEMLDYCSKYGIVADVEIIPIGKVNEAFERILRNEVRYRFVIDMESLEG